LSSTLAGTSFNPNPVNCPGTSTLTVTPTTQGTFSVPVSGTFGTAPAVNATPASLTVQQLILRPTVFTANGSFPQYTSPGNAADGNSSTFSSGPTATGPTSEFWSGFGTITGTPTQMLLKVTSSASCDSGSGTDGVAMAYGMDGTNNNLQTIYGIGVFGPISFAGVYLTSANRPLTTDVISLPVTTNPANVNVFTYVYSPSLFGCHKIYDVWIELTF
jgi:hypothetical protein